MEGKEGSEENAFVRLTCTCRDDGWNKKKRAKRNWWGDPRCKKCKEQKKCFSCPQPNCTYFDNKENKDDQIYICQACSDKNEADIKESIDNLKGSVEKPSPKNYRDAINNLLGNYKNFDKNSNWDTLLKIIIKSNSQDLIVYFHKQINHYHKEQINTNYVELHLEYLERELYQRINDYKIKHKSLNEFLLFLKKHDRLQSFFENKTLYPWIDQYFEEQKNEEQKGNVDSDSESIQKQQLKNKKRRLLNCIGICIKHVKQLQYKCLQSDRDNINSYQCQLQNVLQPISYMFVCYSGGGQSVEKFISKIAEITETPFNPFAEIAIFKLIDLVFTNNKLNIDDGGAGEKLTNTGIQTHSFSNFNAFALATTIEWLIDEYPVLLKKRSQFRNFNLHEYVLDKQDNCFYKAKNNSKNKPDPKRLVVTKTQSLNSSNNNDNDNEYNKFSVNSIDFRIKSRNNLVHFFGNYEKLKQKVDTLFKDKPQWENDPGFDWITKHKEDSPSETIVSDVSIDITVTPLKQQNVDVVAQQGGVTQQQLLQIQNGNRMTFHDSDSSLYEKWKKHLNDEKYHGCGAYLKYLFLYLIFYCVPLCLCLFEYYTLFVRKNDVQGLFDYYCSLHIGGDQELHQLSTLGYQIELIAVGIFILLQIVLVPLYVHVVENENTCHLVVLLLLILSIWGSYLLQIDMYFVWIDNSIITCYSNLKNARIQKFKSIVQYLLFGWLSTFTFLVFIFICIFIYYKFFADYANKTLFRSQHDNPNQRLINANGIDNKYQSVEFKSNINPDYPVAVDAATMQIPRLRLNLNSNSLDRFQCADWCHCSCVCCNRIGAQCGITNTSKQYINVALTTCLYLCVQIVAALFQCVGLFLLENDVNTDKDDHDDNYASFEVESIFLVLFVTSTIVMMVIKSINADKKNNINLFVTFLLFLMYWVLFGFSLHCLINWITKVHNDNYNSASAFVVTLVILFSIWVIQQSFGILFGIYKCIKHVESSGKCFGINIKQCCSFEYIKRVILGLFWSVLLMIIPIITCILQVIYLANNACQSNTVNLGLSIIFLLVSVILFVMLFLFIVNVVLNSEKVSWDKIRKSLETNCGSESIAVGFCVFVLFVLQFVLLVICFHAWQNSNIASCDAKYINAQGAISDLFLVWLVVYILILVIVVVCAVAYGCKKIGINANIKILDFLCKYGKCILCCQLTQLFNPC